MAEDYRTGIGLIYDLAAIYGIHRNTVAQYLKRRGVRLRHSPLCDSEIKSALKLRDRGLSLNAIGRELQRDPMTIKAALPNPESRGG